MQTCGLPGVSTASRLPASGHGSAPFGVGIFSRPRWANVPRPERAAGDRSSCPSSVAARRRAAEGADGLRPVRRFNLPRLPSQELGLGASLFCYKYLCESEEKPRPAGQPASPSGGSTRPDGGPGSPHPLPPLARPRPTFQASTKFDGA